MIAGIYHKGSGLGNQLHRYVGTRIIAEEKGKKHTMIAPELFKGKDFLNLDIVPNIIPYSTENFSGRVVPLVDKKIVEVIDGEFQDPKYFIHRLDDVRRWLEPKGTHHYHDMNTCIINFRGGEYVGHPVFLPQSYWDGAIGLMKEKGVTKFEVHTDDPITAKQFFPDFPIVSDIEKNWKAVRYASHLIISNSSFAILPALINDLAQEIVAPKYWAGYNQGEWVGPKYDQFTYI